MLVPGQGDASPHIWLSKRNVAKSTVAQGQDFCLPIVFLWELLVGCEDLWGCFLVLLASLEKAKLVSAAINLMQPELLMKSRQENTGLMLKVMFRGTRIPC